MQLHAHPSARTWGALGGWLGEQHRFACAIPAFQSALLFDPDSARLHYFLALSLYSSGRAKESASEFHRALQLDPRDLEAYLALGVALHQLGRAADAEAAWEAALNLDPDSVTALDWLAKARIDEGQFGAAVELLSTSPHNEDLTLDLALAYSQAGQFVKATKTLENEFARSASPRVGAALGTVYVQAHRYQDATNLLRAALQAHPDDSAIELLYLRVLVLQDDDADAQPLAKKFLEAHPDNFDALYLSGVVENDLQQYTSAVDHLKSAAALNPGHFDVRFNLGIAYAHLKKNDAARTQLEKAVALDPAKAEAHFQLAQVLRAQGQMVEAQEQLKLFAQCRQATTTLALGQTKAGQAAQALDAGNATEAVALYREAIEALPHDATLQYNLALALDRTGDQSGERSALERALQLKPSFAEVHNQLGLVLTRSRDANEAEQQFREAIAAAPSYAEAANNLGTLLGQQGRDHDAETSFRSAVAANPRFAQAWINLAATLASESRFLEARAAVDAALRIDPRDADALRLRQMLPSNADGRSPTPDPAPVNDAARKPHS
ncbi:MAG: tetratricopeptide repeat protein [Terracidiphilus sp.]